jgi:hypothetical protein
MTHRPGQTAPPRRRTAAASTGRSRRCDAPAAVRLEAIGADREPLAPSPADSARHVGNRPRRGPDRSAGWPPRVTRGRVLVLLAVGLVVLLGGLLATGAAAAAPGRSPVAAQPAPAPPLPLPTVDCLPGSPPPVCDLPAPTTTPPSTAPAGGVPLPVPTDPGAAAVCFPGSLQPDCLGQSTTDSPPVSPCTGVGCIPQPGTPAPSNPGASQPDEGGETGEGEAECGISDIGACVTEAIDGFFRGLVEDALNPLLDLLGKTLLTTPTPDQLPRIGELWTNSWQILLASYGLLVLIAGVLVMSYQTLQTRHGIKEIAPRLVVGFLAGALSLWVATQAIQIANGLSRAVMGTGVDATTAGETLRTLVLGSLGGGIFMIFLGLFLAAMLVLLLVTYIVRVALTVILIAGAPLALMCHALPQTEGVAYWWWKAGGGCLAIQVGQSLTLITTVKVFLAPGGFTLFGPTINGLVNLLVALALTYILFKIPFWILGSIRGSGRGSLVGSLVRGFLAYKTYGLLGSRSGGGGSGNGGGRSAGSPSGGHGAGGGGRGPAADPYARTTDGGQYLLPLTGVRRTRPAPQPRPAAAPRPGGAAGRQLTLPLGEDWPENRPVLGRDGQYRLPLDVQRVMPAPPLASPGQPVRGGRPRGRSRSGHQLPLPLDPYRGNRPNRDGQYPLPLNVRRTPRPPSRPPVPAAPPPSRMRITQPELPFDPYKGNRATRSGQYPLPLEGLRRVPPTTPAPVGHAPGTPAPAARPAPRKGRQLRLPLDLPKPAHRTPSRSKRSGGKS